MVANSPQKRADSSWFQGALDTINALADNGIKAWTAKEQMKTAKETQKVKNQMSLNDSYANMAINQQKANTQRMITALAIGGIALIALVFIYRKVLRW